jgi:hypothetical protein
MAVLDKAWPHHLPLSRKELAFQRLRGPHSKPLVCTSCHRSRHRAIRKTPRHGCRSSSTRSFDNKVVYNCKEVIYNYKEVVYNYKEVACKFLRTSILKFFIVAAKLPTSVAKLPTAASKLHMVASKLDIGVLKMHCIKVTYLLHRSCLYFFFMSNSTMLNALVLGAIVLLTSRV